MIQHIDEEYAEIWHARFKVLGMPVFYSPYLQFPIGDRRRSGLLIPNFHRSSKDGFAYSQPFYWNIAPNMDATITPTYYSRRGWQISPEYRFIGISHRIWMRQLHRLIIRAEVGKLALNTVI